jgi:pimeloyl-ACP methyl ester carboxylesterase
MKKSFLSVFSVSAFLFHSLALGAPGDLLKLEPLSELSGIQAGRKESCPKLAGVEPKLSLKRYKVVYETTGPHGEKTTASGLFLVPVSGGDLPVLSYQHGTIVKRADVPSRLSSESVKVGHCFASLGMVVAMPDYLGLGDSPLDYHPYHHSESTASSAADLLSALKKAEAKLEISLSGQLFLSGYSQGGHATLALQKALEEKGVSVTASAPLSGAYDLSHTFFRLLKVNAPRSTAEVSYAILAMERVYGLSKSLGEVFRAPYAKQIPQLFDGSRAMPEVVRALPALPGDVLQPAFLEAAKANANHPHLVALRKNDVFDWKPVAPVRLMFGAIDLEVPPDNAQKALTAMKKRGADVQAVNLGKFDHRTARVPAYEEAGAWFRSLME